MDLCILVISFIQAIYAEIFKIIFFVFTDDDRDGDEGDKSNKCSLVWEVRSFYHVFSFSIKSDDLIQYQVCIVIIGMYGAA